MSEALFDIPSDRLQVMLHGGKMLSLFHPTIISYLNGSDAEHGIGGKRLYFAFIK